MKTTIEFNQDEASENISNILARQKQKEFNLLEGLNIPSFILNEIERALI